MGLRRLDDAELGRRVRARNRDANAAMRVRRLNAGQRQLNVFVSISLREQVDGLALESGQSLSVVVERLITDGLTYRQPSATSPVSEAIASIQTAPESLPLFEPAPTESESAAKRPRLSPVDAKARDEQILALHQQGLSGHAIGRMVGCAEKTVRTVLKRVKGESD